MTIGDPRKALVLAVVAIIVCGLAVFRVLPKPEVAVQSLLVPPQAHSPSTKMTVYPQALSHDPFSHPMIVGNAAPPSSSPRPLTDSPPFTFDIDGELPEVAGDDEVAGGAKPEENAGDDRKPDQESTPKHLVRLDAVMTVDEPVAVLRLDGGKPQAMRVGDLAFGIARVVEIGPSRVRLQAKKKMFEVGLGDSVSL